MGKQEFPYTGAIPNRFEMIDASAADVTPAERCIGIYMNSVGNVGLVDRAGNSIALTAVPAGTTIWGEVAYFESDNTTVSDVLALCVGSNA